MIDVDLLGGAKRKIQVTTKITVVVFLSRIVCTKFHVNPSNSFRYFIGGGLTNRCRRDPYPNKVG